ESTRRISADLRRADGENFHLFFETDDPSQAFNSGLADPFVIASAQFFMQVGGAVNVNQPISHKLMIGIEEWVGAFSNMYPALFKRVRFVPSKIEESSPTTSYHSGVMAFSGGVDAF